MSRNPPVPITKRVSKRGIITVVSTVSKGKVDLLIMKPQKKQTIEVSLTTQHAVAFAMDILNKIAEEQPTRDLKTMEMVW